MLACGAIGDCDVEVKWSSPCEEFCPGGDGCVLEVEVMTAEELLERYASGERDFSGVNLDDVDVSGRDLQGINLNGSSLNQFFADGTNLSQSDLSMVCLYQGGLEDRILRNTNLSRSDLGSCNLRRANLEGANLEGAIFDNTWMPDGSFRSSN
jgi:uncharacterized protein YjbI with pentapeptide repeats